MVSGGQHPEASPAKHREAPQSCLTPPLSPCFIFCTFLYFLLLISLLPQHRHFPPASCLKHGTVLLRKKKNKELQPHTFNFLISMPARKIFLQLLEAATKTGPKRTRPAAGGSLGCQPPGTAGPGVPGGTAPPSIAPQGRGVLLFVRPPPLAGASQDFFVSSNSILLKPGTTGERGRAREGAAQLGLPRP